MDSRSTGRTAAGGGRTTERDNQFFERLDQQPDAARAVSERTLARPGAQPAERRAADAGSPTSMRSTVQSAARVSTLQAGTTTRPVGQAARALASSWGWLPELVLVGAFGLVSVGQAMRVANEQQPGASFLFWLGLLLIYAPVAFRMALPQTSRRERIVLAVWLGLALYLVKILRSPAGFTFHDEFPHYATADGILRTQHLFSANSLQEVSAYFPGLEIVTAALVSVGGLSIEAAGLVVVAAARLIAALAIYLLYEEISGSPRVAGLGSVLAITYPNYIFWSSQYSYESLALPLSLLVLVGGLLKARRSANARAWRTGLTIIGLLMLAAVSITHHLTSYFLAGTLIALVLLTRFGPAVVPVIEPVAARLPKGLGRLLPWTLWTRLTEHVTGVRDWAPLTLGAAAFAVLWLTVVGSELAHYLVPHVQAASAGLAGLITRSSGGRTPFSTNTATTAAPVWEQLVAFAAVLLIIGLMPFALLQIWRRYRRHGMALLFVLVAIAYPFTLVLRLASGGAEIANRLWDFLFVALGFVLATAVAELWMAREHLQRRAVVFAGYASILLMGALIVGTPGWARLPGSYMVGGDTRGLQAESYAATGWARQILGPDNRFIADTTNELLLGSFGEQYVVEGESWVYLSPKLSPQSELADLVNRGVAYVVVDDRLATQTPRLGFYFEAKEPGSPWRKPLPASFLAKFDQQPCLSRVFDSGHITIYGVSANGCAHPSASSNGGTK